jgi:hypothetical protein
MKSAGLVVVSAIRWLLLASFLTLGCTHHTDAGAPPVPEVVGTGTLLGSVKTVMSDEPVANATIRVGDAVVDVNESGWFVLPDVPAGDRVLVEVSAKNMVPTQRIVSLADKGRTFLDARLFPKAPAIQLDPALGGTVSTGQSQVVLGPDILKTLAGKSPKGMANVSLTYIDPTSRDQRLATPGDFTATVDGKSADLESYGMVYLSITDAEDDDAELTFAKGAKADVTISVPTITGAPLDTTPLWSYDSGSGRWVKSGDASYDPQTRTYSSTIDKPAYWNCDQPYATACWTGRVVTPEGAIAPAGIKVAAEGVTYIGESTSWTDADGRFAVRVMASTAKKPATARVFAEGTGRYAELDPMTTPTTLASTGECEDLGEIQLTFPLAAMVLTWGETPRDLDSHFTGPIEGLDAQRFHMSFSDRDVGSAFLDTDDTSSFGPEVTSLLRAVPGTYVYTVHNFSGESAGPIVSSGANVLAILPNEERAFDVADADASQLSESTANGVWRVFQFDVDSEGTLSDIVPINELVDSSDDAYQP